MIPCSVTDVDQISRNPSSLHGTTTVPGALEVQDGRSTRVLRVIRVFSTRLLTTLTVHEYNSTVLKGQCGSDLTESELVTWIDEDLGCSRSP